MNIKKIIVIYAILLSTVVMAQEEQTVTLTVSGSGKTIEEARLNALRTAVEQAFGTFISSNTEILNDDIVKDEIISVANGNVQKYDIVSQLEIPNVGYAITLNTTVSIAKLTSFAESKGVEVEFKGGMFGTTIKLQKLNEESEYLAIKNLLVQTLSVLESSYDYSLKVETPLLINDDNYFITLDLVANSNDNYKNLWDFFKKTVSKISLNMDDELAILNTGKKIWYLKIDDDIYKLRNEKSFNAIFNFSVVSSLIASNTYYFKNNIETVKIKNSRTASFFDIAFGKYLSNRDNNYDNSRGTIESIYIIDLGVKYKLLDFIKSNDLNIKSIFRFPLIVAMHDGKIIASENYNSVSIKTNFTFKNYSFYLSDPDRYMIKSSMRYDLEYKLQYLEKIESFKIEKIPFFELINKYNLYRY